MFRFTLVAGALTDALNGFLELVEVTSEDLDSTPTCIEWSPLSNQGQCETVYIDISTAQMNCVS